MDQKKGFLSLLSAGFLFGTFGIWVRILNQELTTNQQILFRQVTGLILATILVFILKQKWSLNKVNKLILVGYGLAFPVSVIFYVLSILNTKISLTTFSWYATSLIFSLIIGRLIFKNKLSFPKILALLFTFIGIAFFSYPLIIASSSFGLLFGLLGGVFDAIANAFRSYLSGKIDRFVLIVIQMLGGILVMSVIMLILKENFLPPISPLIFLVGIVFGIVLMLVNLFLLIGFQNFDLNLGTIILSSELIFATIFGVVLYKEYPNMKELIGSFFILIAIIIPNLPEKIYGRFAKKS